MSRFDDAPGAGITGAMSLAATDALAARGRSHTLLRELLDARAALLHREERELLLDAADALLFDEPEAADKRENARALLAELIASERWMVGPAEGVLTALDGCGGRFPVPLSF
jgi:hypothetical protein